MRQQIVVKLPKHIGAWITQGIVKSILLKNDYRDITIKIVESESLLTPDIDEIILNID